MNPAFNSHSLFMLVCRSDAGSDSNEAAWSDRSEAVKHWSDSSEVVEGGATAPLHSRVKGDKVAPLCQPWATFHRNQVNPAFNSSSLFVLFVGARHAATAMKPWSVERQQWSAVKQWSDSSGAVERQQ